MSTVPANFANVDSFMELLKAKNENSLLREKGDYMPKLPSRHLYKTPQQPQPDYPPKVCRKPALKNQRLPRSLHDPSNPRNLTIESDIEQYTVIHAMKYIQGATAQRSHADFAIWPRTLTEAAR